MNILITSVGRRAYIVRYFQEALRGNGLVHACNSEETIGTQTADRSFIAPSIYSDEYIPCLVDYCEKNDIDALFSLFDIDLLVLAENRRKLEDVGARLVLAPVDFVMCCNDKLMTVDFIRRIGLNTPKTFGTLEAAEEALESGELTFPIILKPRWGMASMAVYVVHNMDELQVLSRRATQEVWNSYLKYESRKTESDVLVYQEFMRGREFGIDAINDLDSNYICCWPKEKVSMRSGETDISLTVDPNLFDHTARTISCNSAHQGICSVDCFIQDDQIYVIEMNCRISGHYPFSQLAGANYPKALIAWLRGQRPTPDCFDFVVGQRATKELVPCILS